MCLQINIVLYTETASSPQFRPAIGMGGKIQCWKQVPAYLVTEEFLQLLLKCLLPPVLRDKCWTGWISS